MRRWQFWAGIAISIIFLWLALRGLSLLDLLRVLPGINYLWLVPGVIVYFIAVWVRAWRWHYLLRPLKSISTRSMFPIVCIGYAGNNIFPARAGEVLRAIVLKRHEGVAISASLATIIIERIFDGVVMLGFVFINLPELANLTADSGFAGSIGTLALVGTFVFIGALGIFLLAAMYPERSTRVVTWFTGYLIPQRYRQKTLDLSNRFLEGLRFMRSPRDVLMVFFTSVIIWLLETGKYWFVMHAFPFEVNFFTLMLMNGIVNLATTIPSAPGYVGTFDAPGIAVLEAYGIEKTLAAAYTLVLHVALWLPITLVGLFYLAREGITWGDDLQKLSVET